MDWLFNLIPGGGLSVLLGAVAAAITALLVLLKKSETAGVNKQKAKEAEARAKNLERLKDAQRARPSGSVLDDPNNRDKR